MSSISYRQVLLFIVTSFFTTSCASLFPVNQDNTSSSTETKIADIEAKYGVRVGLSAINIGNNKRLQYRDDERFPVCSTFKLLAVAAILKQSMKEPNLLQKHVVYTKDDTTASGYAPVTEKNLSSGMSILELCESAIRYSDNAASNLLVKELGGPDAVTAFARTIGDETFRLDRWEPELNSAIPGDLRDTSTPSAMEESLQSLLLGEVLAEPQRKQLITWLKDNTTGAAGIRAGVPEGWTVGDKTGSGAYGTRNDIGIIWPTKGGPIIVTIYSTQNKKDAIPLNEVIAATAKVVVSVLQ